jgi:hypothetical protein
MASRVNFFGSPPKARLGPVRNPVLNTGCVSVFPGSSRLGIEPKTPGWLVQDPTTRPIGDRGSGAHPGRGSQLSARSGRPDDDTFV